MARDKTPKHNKGGYPGVRPGKNPLIKYLPNKNASAFKPGTGCISGTPRRHSQITGVTSTQQLQQLRESAALGGAMIGHGERPFCGPSFAVEGPKPSKDLHILSKSHHHTFAQEAGAEAERHHGASDTSLGSYPYGAGGNFYAPEKERWVTHSRGIVDKTSKQSGSSSKTSSVATAPQRIAFEKNSVHNNTVNHRHVNLALRRGMSEGVLSGGNCEEWATSVRGVVSLSKSKDRNDRVGAISDFSAQAAAAARADKKSALPLSAMDPEPAPPKLTAEENQALQRKKRMERGIGLGWVGVGETALLSSDSPTIRSPSCDNMDQPVWRHAPALSCPRLDPFDDEEFIGRRERNRERFNKAELDKEAKDAKEAMIKPFTRLATSLTEDDLYLLRCQTLRTENLEKNPPRKKPSPPKHPLQKAPGSATDGGSSAFSAIGSKPLDSATGSSSFTASTSSLRAKQLSKQKIDDMTDIPEEDN